MKHPLDNNHQVKSLVNPRWILGTGDIDGPSLLWTETKSVYFGGDEPRDIWGLERDEARALCRLKGVNFYDYMSGRPVLER